MHGTAGTKSETIAPSDQQGDAGWEEVGSVHITLTPETVMVICAHRTAARLRTSLSPEALGAGSGNAYRGAMLFSRLTNNMLRVGYCNYATHSRRPLRLTVLHPLHDHSHFFL
jgi:hypothetical protein